MVITVKQCHDMGYAKKLVITNMAGYYKERGIEWDQDLFEKSWASLSNFEIYFNDFRVGVIRISTDEQALYIRDLQIEEGLQGRGIGTAAIEWVSEFARDKGFEKLKLRVFENNPAVELYKKLGFSVEKHDPGLIHMRKMLPNH